jgi:hypothetical protein
MMQAVDGKSMHTEGYYLLDKNVTEYWEKNRLKFGLDIMA